MSPIRVEAGPMFSGKSSELINNINRQLQAERTVGKNVLVFNHASDTRYGKNLVSSHNGTSVEAIAAQDSAAILDYICDFDGENIVIKPGFAKLVEIHIDEAQFFDENLPVIVEFIDHTLGVDVYVYGLDTDFRGFTFGPMGDLMALADHVEKRTAVCKKRIRNGEICGEPATKTQRLVNGEPAKFTDPIILVGAQESYTARCVQHHEVPGKPSLNLSK